MSESESKLLTSLRNQILGVVVAAAGLGLLTNFLFITTINSTVKDLKVQNKELVKKNQQQDHDRQKLWRELLTNKN